jgi:hypothetical protein
MEQIRKISIGKDYKNDSMHYAVGQSVWGDNTIKAILESGDRYTIYIGHEDEIFPWKDFNKNMAISVEYDVIY